jgi:hypothetical protein
MTKKEIFYIVMMVISIIILIVGVVLCKDANSVWDVQMAQITSGLDISPVWWTPTRIWGDICMLGGLLSLIVFGILTAYEFD